MKENVKKPVFRLTLSAIFIALATVLSMVKIYEPPLGGGVTLFSMLPIVMISCLFGIKWGLGVSFLYGLIQMGLSFAEVMSWGLTPWVLVAVYAFDYVVPYFLLGFAGIFAKKGIDLDNDAAIQLADLLIPLVVPKIEIKFDAEKLLAQRPGASLILG